MLALIIVITSIVQLVLALFVFFRSRSSLSNRLFFLISLAMLGWALSDYLSAIHLHSSDDIYYVRAVLFFVVLQNAFFYTFARNFPSSRWQHSKRGLLVYGVITGAVAALTLSPYVFASVIVQDGKTSTEVAPGIIAFMVHALFSIVTGFRALFRRLDKARGPQRSQLEILLSASVVVWVIVPITNFVITQLVGTVVFTEYAPLYTLFFAAIIAYAIIAKKLFDIRAAVARSVAYAMVLAAVALIYSVIFFGVVNVVFPGDQHQLLRQIMSIILVAPLALAFQALKQVFDRWTNRLFYRESYDFQAVLDHMGILVAEEIELHKILNRTRGVLTGALKSSYIEFIVLKNGRPYFEARTTRDIDPTLLALGKSITHQRGILLSVDDSHTDAMIVRGLKEVGAALSLKLETRSQVVGYVILGDKRSGDVYTAQDEKLLRILARELAIAVQNALRFEEIQNFNLTLQGRVDEATRKLRHANQRLKELDETKDDFISMASHQLRTPLTSVKGYISMLMEGDAGKINHMQREMLGQAFFSSQRMVYLIADLLNVSRLKTGKFVIEPTPVDLSVVVEEELAQLEETAASRDLKLTYDKPKHFPQLMLDEVKTRQVIMNFVDNAIYYTPQGGHIDVQLTEKSGTVELRVTDDGIGVPKSEQPHLFTKFYRAGNARKARPDGTGLGLFMAKKVIVAQGGSLIFESKEGKGSTFGFVFSRSKLAAPDKPAAATEKPPLKTEKAEQPVKA